MRHACNRTACGRRCALLAAPAIAARSLLLAVPLCRMCTAAPPARTCAAAVRRACCSTRTLPGARGLYICLLTQPKAARCAAAQALLPALVLPRARRCAPADPQPCRHVAARLMRFGLLLVSPNSLCCTHHLRWHFSCPSMPLVCVISAVCAVRWPPASGLARRCRCGSWGRTPQCSRNAVPV